MLSRQSTRHSLDIPRALEDHKGRWGTKGSETSFFRENVPIEPVDFGEAAESTGIKDIFTSDKLCTAMMGSFNCNMVYRQTKVVPDILLFGNDKHIVLQPLGEPGRDLGEGHTMKSSHTMVVTYADDAPITLNEMLPTTPEENKDTAERLSLLDSAYAALKSNSPISKCGKPVIEKASKMGLPVTMGLREFMAKQISSFTPEFREGRPGYKLMSGDMVDIAASPEEGILAHINTTFDTKGLSPHKMIQGPDNCSQLLSHIHGFLLPPGDIPEVLATNYISVEDILKAKGYMGPVKVLDAVTEEEEVAEKRTSICEKMGLCGSGDDSDDDGDENMLTRQLTAADME